MSLAACAAGFLLDFIFGDPVWLYHPVRLIGKGIAFGERQLRKLCSRRQRQGSENEQTDGRALVAAGTILWVCVAGLSFLIPLSVLILVQKIHPALHSGVIRSWLRGVCAKRAGKCMTG